MPRTQLLSGFGSMNMRYKAQERLIIVHTTKTIQILKSEIIEVRNYMQDFA